MNVWERREEDVLAYLAFSNQDWKQICLPHSLKRLELVCRFDVFARRYVRCEYMEKNWVVADEELLFAATSVLEKRRTMSLHSNGYHETGHYLDA